MTDQKPLTPPPTDEKALPDLVLPKFERDGATGIPQVLWPWNSECMRLADLAAVLAALDPDVRARVLEPYQNELRRELDDAKFRREEALGCRDADEAMIEQQGKALTAARSEVERLRAFLRRVPTTRTSPNEPFLVCLGCGAVDSEDCATACWVYELEGLVHG